MNYILHWSDIQGVKPNISLADKQIDDSSTTLILKGHDSVSWGESLIENQMHLLESFASSTPPQHPTSGQLWYDTNPNVYVLKIYNGTSWDNISAPSTVEVTVITPVITDPGDTSDGIPTTTTIQGSNFAETGGGLPGDHLFTDWEVRTGANGGGSMFTSFYGSTQHGVNLQTYHVTGLNGVTPYWVRVRYNGSVGGYSAWSDWSTFTTLPAASIAKPTIAINGTTNVSITPTLTLSKFKVVNGIDQYVSTDWQVMFGNGSVAWSSMDDSIHRSSIQTSELLNSTPYTARARYKGLNTGYSEWSNSVGFTTISIITPPTIDQPTLSIPYDNNSVPLLPVLNATVFSVSNGTDTYESTRWEVRTGPNGTGSPVFQPLPDGDHQTSIQLTTPLYNSTTYYARVQHRGSTVGDGPWSSDVVFTTLAATITPTVQRPIITRPYPNGVTGIPLTDPIEASNFALSTTVPNPQPQHINSDWQLWSAPIDTSTKLKENLADAVHKVSHVFPDLTNSTTYYARVRYRSNTLGVSEWSEFVGFTTAAVASGITLSETLGVPPASISGMMDVLGPAVNDVSIIRTNVIPGTDSLVSDSSTGIMPASWFLVTLPPFSRTPVITGVNQTTQHRHYAWLPIAEVTPQSGGVGTTVTHYKTITAQSATIESNPITTNYVAQADGVADWYTTYRMQSYGYFIASSFEFFGISNAPVVLVYGGGNDSKNRSYHVKMDFVRRGSFDPGNSSVVQHTAVSKHIGTVNAGTITWSAAGAALFPNITNQSHDSTGNANGPLTTRFECDITFPAGLTDGLYRFQMDWSIGGVHRPLNVYVAFYPSVSNSDLYFII